MRVQTGSSGAESFTDKNATFGQRRTPKVKAKTGGFTPVSADGGFEMSWVPSSSQQTGGEMFTSDGGDIQRNRKERRKGMEVFGAGMEKGEDPSIHLTESERKGRTQRRKGVRSGSKNTFRRLES